MKKEKAMCANCGSTRPFLIWFDGKWYCPGACVVKK